MNVCEIYGFKFQRSLKSAIHEILYISFKSFAIVWQVIGHEELIIPSISSSSMIFEAALNAGSYQYFIPSGYAKTSPAIETAFEANGFEKELESFSTS